MQTMVEAANYTSGHASEVLFAHIRGWDLHFQTKICDRYTLYGISKRAGSVLGEGNDIMGLNVLAMVEAYKRPCLKYCLPA